LRLQQVIRFSPALRCARLPSFPSPRKRKSVLSLSLGDTRSERGLRKGKIHQWASCHRIAPQAGDSQGRKAQAQKQECNALATSNALAVNTYAYT
jgi:hypothetical protein